MLDDLLNSPNPLVKFGFATFAVFAPLYVLQSFGLRWPFLISLIILVLILTRQVGGAGASFRPDSGTGRVS